MAEPVVGSGRIELMGPVYTYEAEPVIWESTSQAVIDAPTRLVGRRHEPGDSAVDTSDR